MEEDDKQEAYVPLAEREIEIKKQAIEAIEITEKVICAQQKVSLSFVIPALSTTVFGLLTRNLHVLLVSTTASILSTWAFGDTISQLCKLQNSKKLIKESRYDEFIEDARTSVQIPTLNNIADVIEEELMCPPDPPSESDKPDYFDDDWFE